MAGSISKVVPTAMVVAKPAMRITEGENVRRRNAEPSVLGLGTFRLLTFWIL